MQVAELIANLIRAANEIDRKSPEELSQLLYDAIVEIVELRQRAGIPAIGTRRDTIIHLRDIANEQTTPTSQERSGALLEAADMLRTLRVLIDSGASVNLLEQEMAE
jgi:hypothetical protein